MTGSAADQTRIWIIALTNFLFTAGAVFFVNAKAGACSTYYSGNLRYDHVSEGPLFWLSVNILATLTYFGLYKFALRMRTDPLLATLAFKRFVEVDSGKTVTKHGFLVTVSPVQRCWGSRKNRYRSVSVLVVVWVAHNFDVGGSSGVLPSLSGESQHQ